MISTGFPPLTVFRSALESSERFYGRMKVYSFINVTVRLIKLKVTNVTFKLIPDTYTKL